MGNTIIFGLIGLAVLLLIVCLVIWLAGRKKAAALTAALASHENEKKDLHHKIAILEEKCNRIAPLEQELAAAKNKQEKLQADIVKLSTDLATEVEKKQNVQAKHQELQEKFNEVGQKLTEALEKSKKLESLSAELAKKDAAILDLQMTVNQSKDKIAALDSQIGEERKNAETQADTIDRLKKLFA